MRLISNIKKSVAIVAATVLIMIGLPAVANAASSWWAKTSSCYGNQIRHTWYQVIDYSWYEETFQGKIDYNYPTLYYPHHYEYTGIYCTRA